MISDQTSRGRERGRGTGGGCGAVVGVVGLGFGLCFLGVYFGRCLYYTHGGIVGVLVHDSSSLMEF